MRSLFACILFYPKAMTSCNFPSTFGVLIAQLFHLYHKPFEHQFQLRPVDLARVHRGPVRHEGSALQTLGSSRKIPCDPSRAPSSASPADG